MTATLARPKTALSYVRTAVIDGRPARVKACRTCGLAKIVTDDSTSEFTVNTRRPDGSVLSWRPNCKPCAKAHDEKRRERFAATLKAQEHARYVAMMADPVRANRRRAVDAERKRAARRDAERNGRIHAQQKAWRERKRRADPAYFAEMKRIQHRLALERKGIAVTRHFANVLRSDDPRWMLPGEPLALAVEAVAARMGVAVEQVCEEAGVPSRRLRDWRAGGSVSFGSADRVLTSSSLVFADVWPVELYPATAVRLGYGEWHPPVAA